MCAGVSIISCLLPFFLSPVKSSISPATHLHVLTAVRVSDGYGIGRSDTAAAAVPLAVGFVPRCYHKAVHEVSAAVADAFKLSYLKHR